LAAPSRISKLGSPDPQAYLFFAALLTLSISLVEILDYFELPFESLAGHLFASGSIISAGFVTSSMTTFGYGGVFALMLLESASLPIPSEVVLPFAGYLVFKGSMNFAAVVLLTTVAGVAGALIDYYFALKLGRPFVERLLKLSGTRSTEQLGRWERWLSAKGAWIILVARFIPGVRSSISLPAGALRMRLRTFVAMTTIGVFGWSVLLVYLGYLAGNLWRTSLVQSSPLLAEVVVFAAAIASFSYIGYFAYVRVKRHQRPSDLLAQAAG
jgi:membrane protein DedA with SNARE-associated domain